MVAGVFCLPFLLVGGLFTLIGYLSYRSEKRKNALCTETVHAVVSELRRISDKDGTTYKPFFTFQYGGYTYTVSSSISSTSYRKKFQEGTEWKIYINPKSPDQFVCKELNSTKLALFFVYFGLFFVFLPIVVSAVLWLAVYVNV